VHAAGLQAQNDKGESEQFIKAFVYKPRWFVLSQTDGEPVEMPQTPEWNKERALAALNISQVPFTDSNGNTQGYARKREIAISPVAAMPHKTTFQKAARFWHRFSLKKSAPPTSPAASSMSATLTSSTCNGCASSGAALSERAA